MLSADPPQGAVEWLQGVVLGAPATSVAMIAVAGLGYEMFFGRISVRRAVQVFVGCFILFGAPSIVAGLRGPAEYKPPPVRLEVIPAPVPLASPSKPPAAYDPYAGAAVPSQAQ